MTPILLLVAALAATPSESTSAPPEASAQLRVEIESLDSDVWGGDGEGIPAIFTLLVTVTIHNDGDEPVAVVGGSFTLPLAGGEIRGKRRGGAVEIASGASAPCTLDRDLSQAQLHALLEDTRDPSKRRLRRLFGRIEFEVRGGARYTPFSGSGRYHHIFD